MNNLLCSKQIAKIVCRSSLRISSTVTRFKSAESESKYSDIQKEKILQVINDADTSSLSRYNITKTRLKKISQWISQNGQIKAISDVELIEGFSQRNTLKFFNSILDETSKNNNVSKKLKGHILHPNLPESVRKSCRTALAVHTTVNSVCWTLIDKSGYEVQEWRYHSIDYPDGKKMQITDVYDVAREVTSYLPNADIYVMKAEATSLRAGGSDPNNPKMLSVNLQKAQIVAMIVALINSRKNKNTEEVEEEESKKHKVYFLRSTLPFRLYGTLIGNEHVSTAQTVESLLQEANEITSDNSKVFVPERLKTMFLNKKELQKDMLGQCLLLALTFMDVCVYRNADSIDRLLKRDE